MFCEGASRRTWDRNILSWQHFEYGHNQPGGRRGIITQKCLSFIIVTCSFTVIVPWIPSGFPFLDSVSKRFLQVKRMAISSPLFRCWHRSGNALQDIWTRNVKVSRLYFILNAESPLLAGIELTPRVGRYATRTNIWSGYSKTGGLLVSFFISFVLL